MASVSNPIKKAAKSSADDVGPANFFISHAWKYNFYDFLVALEIRFKNEPCVYLWIDNFCHNQHEELTSDEWITVFEQHIVSINNTVMIVFPWDNPIPFTRAWCLLEVFYSTNNKVPFEVYLSEEQRKQFLELARGDPGKAALIFSRISTRQSTCWVLNDKLRIHSIIESSVGFEAVDQQVHEAIAKALQVDQAQILSQIQLRIHNQSSETISVAVTMEEKKQFLAKWLRENGMIRENKTPSSIDVILGYDL
eukprot:gene24961-32521_t